MDGFVQELNDTYEDDDDFERDLGASRPRRSSF